MNLKAKLPSKKKFRFIKNIIQINSTIILHTVEILNSKILNLIIINYKIIM